MPTSVLQAPLETEPTRAIGKTTFRKQVLRRGRIVYQGRTIEFSADYLNRLASNFKRRAFDQVPFVLADAENRHTADPERVRGEVKGLEVNGDGLDAIIELSSDGAKLIASNPKLGVSARIVEDARPEIGTPRSTPAVQHVCGTLDPRLPDLRDWEAVSDLATSYSASQVIDLTAETYQEMPPTDGTTTTLTDEQKAALAAAKVPEDQYEAVAAIFAKSDDGEGKDAGTAAATSVTADKVGGDKKDDEPTGIKALLAKITGRKPEEFSDAKIAALTDSPENKDEPAEVALSATAQQGLDSAAADSAEAKRVAEAAQAELRKERFERRKLELTSKGVPPAMIDLAAPLLTGPDDSVIELSATEKTSPREIAEKLLAEAEGTIDLSGPLGSTVADDDPVRTEAKELAKAAREAG